MTKNFLIKTIVTSIFFVISLFLTPAIANAATYTVDSTGDQADLATNGLCATSLGTCTLRAAISETNAAAGPHTINFNIPTSDAGYRDYNDQATASSGNSTGGNDFWTIKPATALPTMSRADVTIDGSTQTTNQGNMNTMGPEIEVDGTLAGENHGFYMTGSGVIINNLVVNRFGSIYTLVYLNGSNDQVTRSYIGTDVSGLVGFSGTDRAAYGVAAQTGTDIKIGNTFTDGNVIAGNSNSGVYVPTYQSAYVRGNYIGLGADGATIIANGVGVTGVAKELGGTYGTQGNIIGGNTTRQVSLGLNFNNTFNIHIYGNHIGTDVTGTLNRGGSMHNIYWENTGTSGYYGAFVYIGALNKGNIIRYGTTSNIYSDKPSSMFIKYNEITNAVGTGVTRNSGAVQSDIDFENNIIRNNSTQGVFLSNTTLGNCTVTNNDIYSNGSSGFTTASSCTSLIFTDNNFYNNGLVGGTASVLPAGSQIYNNIAYGNANSGLQFSSAGTGSTIHDNESYSNLGGMTFTGSTGSNLQNNKFYNNLSFGLSLNNNTAGIIQNNEIYNNKNANIRLININARTRIQNNIIHTHTPALQSTSEDISCTGCNDYYPLPNDLADADSGVNNQQNWPDMTQVTYLGESKYKVEGRLDGNLTEAPFEIEICLSDGNANGHGGCLETLDIITTASVPDLVDSGSNWFNWENEVEIPGSDGTDDLVFTSLATNALNSTSEFGNNVTVPSDSDFEYLQYPVELVTPTDSTTISDTTPLLDWEASALEGEPNPEVDHYDVIVDNVVVATVAGNVTQYQLVNALSGGSHTWKVIAYREGNIVTGESTEETFTVSIPVVDEPQSYDFDLISPINGAIVTVPNPKLDWEDIDDNSGADFYDLYLNNKFIKNTSLKSEFQLESDLTNGTYNWQVIAYKFIDLKAEEVGRSNIESFVVEIPTPQPEEPVTPPETGEEPKPETPKPADPILPDFVTNIRDFKLETLAPAVGIVAATATVALSATLLTAAKDIIEKIGFLIGGIVPKKRKYWGVVFDAAKSQGIPFAVVRIYDEFGKLLNTTVTDLDGRYGVPVSEAGKFGIEVKANGYRDFKKSLTISQEELKEIILDIPLERNTQRIDPIRRFVLYHINEIFLFFRLVILTLMVCGFLYTLYIFLQYPILLNFVILMLYLGLFIFNLWLEFRQRRNVEGRVVDIDTHSGLPNTTVILYNSKGEQEDLRLTNQVGVAKLRAKSGSYQVQALKSGYMMSDLESGKSSLELKVDERGYLTKAIFMRKS